MSNSMKSNRLRYLVFLLPILMLSFFFLPYELTRIANWGLYLIMAIYPIINAAVFFNNKILLWSAPIVFFAATAICALIMFESSRSIIVTVGLISIGWSLVCTVSAILIKRIVKSKR